MGDALVCEFVTADAAIAAAAHLHELGYERIEAYTPYPVPHLEEHLSIHRTKIPVGVLAMGIAGAATAFLILWWTNSINYPLNVGARPYNGLPAHVPIVFETTVLFASATAFLAALFASGLPRLHHRVFELDGFERTSIDRFWITVGDVHPTFSAELPAQLTALGASSVRRLEDVP
jgi:hypothetical protein